MSRTTPEGLLKKRLRTLMNERGVYSTPIPGGAYGSAGAPDMVACYKGRFIAIEAKVGHNTLSHWQIAHKERIEAAGGIYIVAYSVDDVATVLDTLDD